MQGGCRRFAPTGINPPWAIRAALRETYPEVDQFRLTDYRVRVLDSSDGTGARVRVLIETSGPDESWDTIGVHDNVIEASWEALVEGILVGLLRVGAKH